jgi:hypothetical protein
VSAVEVMARQMCWTMGDNPDLLVYPPMQHSYAMSIQHVLLVPQAEYYQPVPMWHLYVRQAKSALEALKDYPPVFGDISKRKGSLGNMYMEDRAAWSEAIDRLLSEEK